MGPAEEKVGEEDNLSVSKPCWREGSGQMILQEDLGNMKENLRS